MAVYRQLQISFWQDAFVLDLTPEEKFFYIYLLSNSKTSQCGIYELPKRIIETETGYNRETVDKLLKRFKEYNKIEYNDDTKEIMIINWIKYNFISSKNTLMCMNKELKEIKNKGFVKLLYSLCTEYGYPIEQIFKGLDRGLLVPTSPLGEEEEKEEEKEKEEQKEEEEEIKKGAPPKVSSAATFEKVIELFNKNIHKCTDIEFQELKKWNEILEPEVIIAAIAEAVIYNKKSYGYIRSVLESWSSRNIRTKAAVAEHLKKRQNQSQGKASVQPNVGYFNNYEQRTYDYDELERKLLGWDTASDGED